MQQTALLYGATGYTGRLICSMANAYGITLILCGRNEAALKKMAERSGFHYRTAALNDAQALDAALQGISVVLHAAGPFRFTAEPMMEACIRNHVHYLDITGEIAVYEMAKEKFHHRFLEKDLMLMPGVGFDVVPTDCIARYLKDQLPDATSLKLAFTSIGGGVSRGTATTAALGLGEPGARRENGKIIPVPLGEHGMYIDFGSVNRFVVSIPWGDVSTAYHTTGIANIETFMSLKPSLFKALKYQHLFNWILRLPFVRRMQLRRIQKGPAGPTPEQREKGKTMIWGAATNSFGYILEARMITPEGYTLTAMSSLHILRKLLAGDVKAGYQTPAGCYGADLILELPGTERF